MKFGNFEIDERAGIIRRNGERLRLQDLPFRLLVILLKRSGEVVTRDELRAELWGSETFVDAEAGLNTGIAKIRDALGDNAESPRFIETLPKRGYRFIVRLDTTSTPSPPPGPAAQPQPEAEASGISRAAGLQPRRRWLALAALGVVAIAMVAWTLSRRAPDIAIAVVRFHNETGQQANDQLAGTLTDAVVVALAENPRYGVIGNSPLLRTDRIFADANKIGQALAADYVLLGQLQSSDAGLVVRAHLIRSSDQKHVWAAPIALPASDREATLSAAIAAGISRALADQ